MRFKESITKGLLISLAVALIPVAAVSAPKVIPGSTCKVLNQRVVYQNKTYTCIKSGKKLLWNKGVVVNAGVKPTPSQSSAPAPLTRREKALGEVKRVFDLNTGYQPTVKYIFANDAPPNFAELIKEVIPFASRFWSSEFRPTTEFPIILGSPASVEWVNSEMKRYGHEIPAWNREFITKLGENASRGDVVNNSRGAITYYVIGKEKDRSIKAGNELTMRGFVAHEYVHAVAISIIGDREKGIPGWSVEGSANFYGFAMAALMADQPNIAMNRINIGNLRRSYSEQGALVPHSLNKDNLYKAVITSEKGGGGDGTTCAEPKILCYTAGALFTEVLVADYGHDKFIDWWKLSRQKNWEVAFEEVFGIQIDKWYEEVAIPYVIQESKGAVPEVPAPKSASTFTQHAARLPRPFVVPGNQNQKPSPTPTTAASFVPPTLPTSFQNLEANLQGIIYGSWLKGSEQLKSGSSNLGDIKVFNGPKSLPGNIDPVAPFKLASQLYSKFEQPKTVYAIVMSYGENEWAQGLFSQYQDLTYGNIRSAVSEICPTQACGQSIAFRNSKWEGILLLQNGARGKNRDSDIRIDSGMEYAHEYFHTVQFYVGRDRYYEAPSWLLEGSANWTGNLVAFYGDYSAYSAWRFKDLGEQYGNPSLFTSAWVEEFLNSYATKKPAKQYATFDYYNGPYPRYYQYAIGAMVTEILVALKGPDSILAMYKTLATGKSFEEAFQSEFAISWNEALPYMSRAISAQLTNQVKS